MSENAPCEQPWYDRVMRWGQTNIRETDALPEHYDIPWWTEHWQRTRVQGVVLNAGGIVAYYPSALELHRRSPYLGGRDLYGELNTAARGLGLAVIARMDSSRANQRFYYEHPDWFTVDAQGQPYRAGEFDGPFYTACISGPYYHEYIPRVLQEICERYQPDGFFDNSWSGLSRHTGICYCPNCRSAFTEYAGGLALPKEKNWQDTAYRAWIEWSYAQRVHVWETNNATVQRYGGPECQWIGNNGGGLVGQCSAFRDWKAMADRIRVLVLDHQGRSGSAPLWQNGEMGKLIRSVLGDAAPIPESIALYNNSNASFRLSSKPEPEVRLWFCEAVAGGIRPWWHYVGADHEDRRMFRTAEPLFTWHETNERFLRDRRHLATVAVVYSQRSADFFGRDDAQERTETPWRGLAAALVRARIPYAMVHVDKLAPQDLAGYRALLLPNVGALTEAQGDALRAYVAAGGSLLATGETSLYDEWGERRADFSLSDLFGAHTSGSSLTAQGREPTYLRFVDPPDQRPAPLAGRAGAGPAFSAGWDETAHLPFGGTLTLTRPAGTGERVPLTYIPPFPTHPPEFAYMGIERTSIPCLYLTEGQSGRGRVAYLPADLDRLYWRLAQPDHADLLAALVAWVAQDELPVRVSGQGLVDVHAYVQGGQQTAGGSGTLDGAERLIVHLVNCTHAGTWKPPVDALNTVGEQRVSFTGRRAAEARLLVAGTGATITQDGEVIVPSIADHEVLVVELA